MFSVYRLCQLKIIHYLCFYILFEGYWRLSKTSLRSHTNIILAAVTGGFSLSGKWIIYIRYLGVPNLNILFKKSILCSSHPATYLKYPRLNLLFMLLPGACNHSLLVVDLDCCMNVAFVFLCIFMPYHIAYIAYNSFCSVGTHTLSHFLCDHFTQDKAARQLWFRITQVTWNPYYLNTKFTETNFINIYIQWVCSLSIEWEFTKCSVILSCWYWDHR